MDSSSKLMEKIREQQVKPIPRWRFILKNSITWTLFILALLFGALAFSVILFSIQQLDFNILTHMSHSLAELLLALLPFFWLISLVILLILAAFSLKNSKKGYKLTSARVIGYSTALSILLGTLFFISGGGKWLENSFATNVSVYESLNERKTKVWSTPEAGQLSGTITATYGDSVELKDFNGVLWIILLQDADIVPAVRLEEGEMIKLTGRMLSEQRFAGDKVRPWGGMQMRGRNN